jgi:autotransporter-associated beta strand protein
VTVDNWNVSGGGSWNTPGNWSTGSVPTIAEDASIGSIATSVTSPATITLDANQTAYGLTLDPGAGKSIRIIPGSSSTNTLTLLSTDTAPDGVNQFFTMNVASGRENEIDAPIAIGGVSKGYTAMINSFDPGFQIKGGISNSLASTGLKIIGNGQGIVSFYTTASTYSGDTTIAPGGILVIGLNNALPSGTGKGNLVLEGNGQLQFYIATALTINGLNSTSSASMITNNSPNNNVMLTVGNANAGGTFAGSISNPSGTVSLMKTGSGTQKLSGANSYNGTTTISAGTLLVDGTHTGAATYSTTGSGATLGGTGTINLNGTNSVNLSVGSLAPGDSGPGVLNINGALNMSSLGTLRVELGGVFPGNGSSFYDQVNMTSPTATINASFAHMLVSLVNGFRPQPTDVFYILTRADSAAFSASQPFDAFPEGATIGLGSGVTGKVTYKANWTGNQATSNVTGGNDMAIFNVIPEPGSASLFGIGMLALFAFRRRRARNESARLECHEDDVPRASVEGYRGFDETPI